MTKFQNQFQNDIAGAASGMMTQMLCAERGIDYNNLMQVAQQNHMQQILQHEQQRQMNTLVKRHYQGDTFAGKIAGLFGGQETNLLMPVPAPNLGQAMPFGQQQQFAQPQLVQQQVPFQQVQQHDAMQTAQMIAQQAIPQAQPQPAVDPQVADLQNQMNEIKSLLSNLVNPIPAHYPESAYVPQQQAPQGYTPAEVSNS